MPSHSQSLIAGSPDAPRRVLILHGYTGSPDEFKDIASEMVKRLDAYVFAPLLPGHGTKDDDLLSVSFDDLLAIAKKYVADMHARGKPFAIIGHSFGGHLAALAAAEFPPSALVMTVTSFALRPPFSLFGMEFFARLKTYWNKKLSSQEILDRGFGFYYKRMPGIGLMFVKRANRLLKTALPKISCPILTINNRQDPLCLPEGGSLMLEISGKNPQNKSVILEDRTHGLFYGKGKEEVVEEIVSFLEKVMLKK